MDVLPPCILPGSTCVPCIFRGQKGASDALDLELGAAMWFWKPNPGLPGEQLVLLAEEPTLQLCLKHFFSLKTIL